MPTTVESRQQELDALHYRVFGPQEEGNVNFSHNSCNSSASRSRAHLDDHILAKARSAVNGSKFEHLYSGINTSEYPSPSEADLALCSILAFWTKDPEQINRIFRSSKRYRPKWDESHDNDASTYGELTIKKALQQTQLLPSDTSQSQFDDLVIVSARNFIQNTPHTNISWVWEGYLANGDITIFVSRPKLGKSTLTWQLVQSIILKNSFLNARTFPQNILVLAVEENPALICQRLTKQGLENSEALFIRAGLCNPTPPFYPKLKELIIHHKIGVLVIDTLTAFWDVSDENNAAQVTRALKPLQEIAQSTGVAILLLHHARKGEGALGEEVRGSSAILATAAISISMKGHDLPNQRKLSMRSRYEATPNDLIVELKDGQYIAHGASAEFNKETRRKRLLEALDETPELPAALAKRAGLKLNQVTSVLRQLRESGRIGVMGKGSKGNPYLYYKINRQFWLKKKKNLIKDI